MALYSLLRRANSLAALPLPLRSVQSSANFSDKGGVTVRSSSGPLLNFSTAAVRKKKRPWADDSNLLRVIDSEIKSAAESELHDCVIDAPFEFPFKIQDKVGCRTVVFEREFEEENIKLVADLSNAGCEENADNCDIDAKDEFEPSIPVVVTITKANTLCLKFDARAFPDRISIRGLTVVETTRHPEHRRVFRGPAFSDLRPNMQVAFQEYLETRGFTSGTAKFLLEYIICKESKEYLRWLKILKRLLKN